MTALFSMPLRGPPTLLPSYTSLSKSTALLSIAALLLLLPMADAHEHATEGIPEGAATSPDPIVRRLPCSPRTCGQPPAILHTDTALLTTRSQSAGLDIMGSHIHQHASLWGHLPPRHGPGRELRPLLLLADVRDAAVLDARDIHDGWRRLSLISTGLTTFHYSPDDQESMACPRTSPRYYPRPTRVRCRPHARRPRIQSR